MVGFNARQKHRLIILDVAPHDGPTYLPLEWANFAPFV